MNRQSTAEQNAGFWQSYFLSPKSLLLLLAVCSIIGLISNAVNGGGILLNILFSLGYGVSISVIETFLATRRKRLPEWVRHLISLLLGTTIGTLIVYSYLVLNGIMTPGIYNMFVNYIVGLGFSMPAFYFFWTRYRNQALQLELRNQQLKAAEHESLRIKAENRLLQAQMEPHFLFNTLANIQTLIDVDSGGAKKMLADLSNMLRAALRYSTADQCSLAQELELVWAYLSIQQVRIGDRLVVREQIDSAALTLPVIPMLLQPLVENAIKHGVDKNTAPTTLQINVDVNEQRLRIEVLDDAPQNNSGSGHGLSLDNIRKRLSNVFGEQATLHAQRQEPGWRSVIEIPRGTT
jgi:sensor histidine kinase YesM